jgi:hypothetical protein
LCPLGRTMASGPFLRARSHLQSEGGGQQAEFWQTEKLTPILAHPGMTDWTETLVFVFVASKAHCHF